MPTVRSPAARARPAAPRLRVRPAAPQAAVLRRVRRENSLDDIIDVPTLEIVGADSRRHWDLSFRKDHADFRKDHAVQFNAPQRMFSPQLLARRPKVERAAPTFSTGARRLGLALDGAGWFACLLHSVHLAAAPLA